MNVNNSSHTMPENPYNAAGGNRLGGIDRAQSYHKYQLCPNGRIKPSKRCFELPKLAEQSQTVSSASAWGKHDNFAGARQTSSDIQLAIKQNIEGSGSKANHVNPPLSWVSLTDDISCSINGQYFKVLQDNILVDFLMNKDGDIIKYWVGSIATQTESSGQKEGVAISPASVALAAQDTLQKYLAKRQSFCRPGKPASRLTHSLKQPMSSLSALRQPPFCAQTPAKAMAIVPDSTSISPAPVPVRPPFAGAVKPMPSPGCVKQISMSLTIPEHDDTAIPEVSATPCNSPKTGGSHFAGTSRF